MRLYRPNFLIKARQLGGIMRLVLFLVLAVVVTGASIVFISENGLRKASLDLKERNRRVWTNEFLAFEKFHSHLVQALFNELVQETNLPSLMTQFHEAQSADVQESVQQAMESEYAAFHDRYRSMGLHSLQFYAPDNCFLHRISPTGRLDTVSNEAGTTVQTANASITPTHGFEDGPGNKGFFWAIPVFADGKHAGCAEFGFSPDSIVAFMMQTFPGRQYILRLGTSKDNQLFSSDLLDSASGQPGETISFPDPALPVARELTIHQVTSREGFFFLYRQPIPDARGKPVATLVALEPGNGLERVQAIRSNMINLGWLGVIFVGCLTGIILFLSSSVKHQDTDHLKKIEKLLSNLPGMLCQWQYNPHTGQMQIPFSSSGIQSLFELQPKDVREDAARLLQKIHPDDVGLLTGSLKESASLEENWLVEFRVRLNSGEEQWRSIAGTPERHRDGSLIWHAYICDSTGKRLEQEKLREANRKLEQATSKANEMAAVAEASNSAKSEFLANMSHDIRTPLNGILGLTEVLMETKLEEEQLLFAKTIRNSAESLRTLINDILDISKIEAGKLEIEQIDFSLNSLMDDFAIPMTVDCQNKDLEFIYSIDLGIGDALKGDPHRLRQILTNLCGNAIKFTTSGHVVVRITRLEESTDNLLLRFSVIDSGIGIPKDKQDLLFRNFTQLDPSISRKYGGSGLGLAISRRLASLMDGETGFTSREGKGSEFWFSARLSKQPGYQVPRDSRIPALSGKTALLSTRSDPARETFANWLTALGMTPVFVKRGLSVMETLENRDASDFPYHLVIEDQLAGGMDFDTMTRFFASRWGDSRMKFLIVTPLSGKTPGNADNSHDFVGWIPKPLNFMKLRVAICSLFHSE